VTAITEQRDLLAIILRDVGDDVVTIFDYVAIGFLAACLMWAATVLIARKS